jgi:hypothetical protein
MDPVKICQNINKFSQGEKNVRRHFSEYNIGTQILLASKYTDNNKVITRNDLTETLQKVNKSEDEKDVKNVTNLICNLLLEFNKIAKDKDQDICIENTITSFMKHSNNTQPLKPLVTYFEKAGKTVETNKEITDLITQLNNTLLEISQNTPEDIKLFKKNLVVELYTIAQREQRIAQREQSIAQSLAFKKAIHKAIEDSKNLLNDPELKAVLGKDIIYNTLFNAFAENRATPNLSKDGRKQVFDKIVQLRQHHDENIQTIMGNLWELIPHHLTYFKDYDTKDKISYTRSEHNELELEIHLAHALCLLTQNDKIKNEYQKLDNTQKLTLAINILNQEDGIKNIKTYIPQLTNIPSEMIIPSQSMQKALQDTLHDEVFYNQHIAQNKDQKLGIETENIKSPKQKQYESTTKFLKNLNPYKFPPPKKPTTKMTSVHMP